MKSQWRSQPWFYHNNTLIFLLFVVGSIIGYVFETQHATNTHVSKIIEMHPGIAWIKFASETRFDQTFWNNHHFEAEHDV